MVKPIFRNAQAGSVKRRCLLRTVALLVASICSLSGQMIWAAEGSVLEEIIVTAQKRTESLQDVPIAVSAFTGDTMRNFGITNTQELQAAVPGLVYSTTGPAPQPFLRGVGSRFALNGLDLSVATYLDDRYVSRASATTLEFADVERVEVLKGPQGTLYGRNAAGGAIRIITKDVADELEGNITGKVGNFGFYSFSGTTSFPVTEDFGIRLSVLTKNRDGFAKNLSPVGVSEVDDVDYQAFRSKFRWKMNEDVTARLALNYWQRNDTANADTVSFSLSSPTLGLGVFSGGISGTKRDEVATSLPYKNDGDAFAADLRFDVSFNSVDLVSITTYTDMKQHFIIDADGTSAATNDITWPSIDKVENFSQEVQLLSNSTGNLQWIAGAYFFSEEGDFDFDVDIGDRVAGRGSFIISQGLQTVKTTSSAAFGQATWNFDEHWAFTLGGRFTKDEKKAKVVTSPFTTGPTVVPVPFNDKDDWSKFTPTAILEYDLDDVMVYLKYSRGFKSGGFNYPASAINQKPLFPETLDMLELGMKSELLDHRLRLDASTYYYDYADLQVARAGAGAEATVTTENAAQAEVFGVDLDLTWLITPALTATGGLNYLDTKYKDYAAVATVYRGEGTIGMGTEVIDASGHPLLRAPKWSFFSSIAYEFGMGDARMPLVVTYSYKDSYFFDFVAKNENPALEADTLKQDAYGLLSARLSYITPDDRWEVSIWGNNLTDKAYFDDVVASSAGLRGSWSAPRTYGLSVEYNF